MNLESFFPPTPEVQHLPTLFRRIQQGEIRIPAFQRGFVWREPQVVELLESVYRGFPIGSLLFWSVKESILRIERSDESPFPEVEERYPLKFLLDGLQRLSTLYGVFHWSDPTVPGMYSVVFDLDQEEFRHLDSNLFGGRTLHLSSLFSPKEFLAAQKSLAIENDSETLIERAIRLHSVFQEYMIPTVTIENRSVPDVVSMFERINSTGTKLNAVDFMRAVTWSQDFDLNTEINALWKRLNTQDFEIPAETLVKAVAVTAGTAPTASAMLDLRNYSPERLHAAVREATATIEKAQVFLEEKLAIRSYEYLPYEGQLLVVLKFFQMGGESHSPGGEKLEQWLWATSFNEELRGKPDHYVARILNRVGDLAAGDMQALSTRLTITPDDFLERRFIKNKALSAAIACMFAKNSARSFLTGDVIPTEMYMRDFSAKNFDGLFDGESLSLAFGREFVSRKVLANTFLFSEDDLIALTGRSPEKIIDTVLSHGPERANEILHSQFVDPLSVAMLKANNVRAFLEIRAEVMGDMAARIVGAAPNLGF